MLNNLLYTTCKRGEIKQNGMSKQEVNPTSEMNTINSQQGSAN